MSDLEQFAAHARAMSTAEHKPECSAYSTDRWGWHKLIVPNPACPGCITDADRALWARLADEADAYLSRNAEAGLFT